MIGLIDYGAGNYASVSNALRSLELDIARVTTPQQVDQVSHLILPGVGAFAAAMRKLQALGLIDALRDAVLKKGKPFLGICVGLQVLASTGREFETCPGLGWIAGSVDKIDLHGYSLRLPHIGWNSLELRRSSPLVAGLGDSPTFYFVHSYHLTPDDSEAVLATCDYGGPVVSIVEKDNIFGVQFHPEKSQHDGLQLLRNFAAL